MLAAILLLLLANIGGIVAKYYFHHPYVFGLVPLFNFDKEANIPTLWSSLSLLCASILLTRICILHKKHNAPFKAWLGLALIFLFLSFDEIASIHERTGQPFTELFDTSGLLFFAWVIPYGIAVLILALVYLKFIMALPNKVKTLFVASAVIFVTGAIGFELLGGRHFETHGAENISYALLYTCEEFLEMLGTVIFIYALLLYIADHTGSLAKPDGDV